MAIKHWMSGFVCSLLTGPLLANPLVTKVPSPETVSAYTQYWQGFDAYEKKIIEDGEEKYKAAWLAVKDARAKDVAAYSHKRLSLLENAIYQYEQHIKDNEFAQNLPYVYLNLAQVQNELANLKDQLSEDGTIYRQKALQVLAKLEQSFPAFPQQEAALYLKGLIFAAMDQDKDAMRVWRKLAHLAKDSLYGVHAKIAVADQQFKDEQAKLALVNYRDALALLEKVPTDDYDYEKLRLQYRIVWASYRSADLKQAVETGISILTPGRHSKKSEIRSNITADAIQLLGDSLYELNDMSYTKDVLRRKVLNEYSSKVAMRALKNYTVSKIYEDVVTIGEYVLGLYPVSEVAADIIIMVADAYEGLGRDDQKIRSLEKLALFLPAESLWRSRFHGNFDATKYMEEKARSASLVISEHYYERGMTTGNPQYFESAASFYTVLLNYEPNSPQSDTYRLKRGHCYYFAEQYQKASDQYDELVAKLKVNHATLKVAAYQSIMSREKIWRNSFAHVAGKQGSPVEHPIVVENLNRLEQAVELFANRFPPKMDSQDSELAIDSLLVAAAANRDHERFKNASKYWQRVLISNPTVGQRAIAIRSLVHAKVFAATPMGIVDIARRFLRLEDWQKLGRTLNNELLGILAKATLDQADVLTAKGAHLEAGHLMVAVAREFKRLPSRARIYRDGAYYLAMGGEWRDAEGQANNFIADNIKDFADDMTYLLARAQEYQMRFKVAANSYYSHAIANPKHVKAERSLERSEILARGESDWSLAARAAIKYAQYSKSRKNRLAIYKRAIDNYNKADDFENALKIAKMRYQLAQTPNERLPAQLDLALAHMKVREEDTGLNEFAKIAESAVKSRDKLNRGVFAEIYGHAKYMLGEESRAQLNDFRILERGQAIRESLRKKLRMYEVMMGHFAEAAKSGHAEWASRSRFLMGLESDRFSDELQSIGKVRKATDSLVSYLNQQTEKLRTIARTQYSANLLAQSRNPREYHDNSWVKKSVLKLNGYLKAKEEFEAVEFGPAALSMNMPSQWSP